MPTISQNRIELNVTGLPAHDSTQMNTVKAATKRPAISVRRVSGEVLRVRLAMAVMSLPRVSHCHDGSARRHHGVAPGVRFMASTAQ